MPDPQTAVIRELHLGETGRAHRAMVTLRPTFADDLERFVARIDQQQRPAGYRLFAAVEPEPADGPALAVAGFRPVSSLSWGDVLYIDDLATHPEHRRAGHGSALLRAVEAEADRLGCAAVHLDSGHHRYAAHRLYLGAGYEIRSHHFIKELGDTVRR